MASQSKKRPPRRGAGRPGSICDLESHRKGYKKRPKNMGDQALLKVEGGLSSRRLMVRSTTALMPLKT